jgi:hypothetical protein
VVLVCPTNREMCSMGIPSSEAVPHLARRPLLAHKPGGVYDLPERAPQRAVHLAVQRSQHLSIAWAGD